MLFTKYLNSFFIFNILLIIFFSLSVTSIGTFQIINSISYVFFHFIIFYLALYYFRKLLFFIFFIYGLAFDLLLIFQIGPHLIIFLTVLLVISQTKRYFSYLNSFKIYCIIISAQLLMVFLEMILSKLLFNYNFNTNVFYQMIIISVIISYPSFLFFSKIDNFK